MAACIGYWSRNRGRGHTKAMVEGAKNVDCLVVSLNYRDTQGDIPAYRRTGLSHLSELVQSSGQMPLILDMDAVNAIFQAAGTCIRELQDALYARHNGRFSADPQSPDWSPIISNMIVSIAGKVIPDVYEADVHEGKLICYVRGEDGKLVCHEDGTPKFLRTQTSAPISVVIRP